ncbi:MAG: aspartate--tRNA ligase, partial [Gammaproteobacteria bacterium]
MRTHYCGELNASHIGQEVALCGWVHRHRDHGGVIFIDLRDREGIVQVVCDPQHPESFQVGEKVRSEFVLRIEGQVRRRPEGTENPHIPTGEIEVLAQRAEILNASLPPPFPIEDQDEASEAVRLKYRYLDLRRPKMLERIRMRARIAHVLRQFLEAEGFIE